MDISGCFGFFGYSGYFPPAFKIFGYFGSIYLWLNELLLIWNIAGKFLINFTWINFHELAMSKFFFVCLICFVLFSKRFCLIKKPCFNRSMFLFLFYPYFSGNCFKHFVNHLNISFQIKWGISAISENVEGILLQT